MSSSLICRSPDLLRLRNEGYHLETRDGYLLIHDVPYVTSKRQVERGTLVMPLTLTANVALVPSVHTAHFIGSTPCDSQGVQLAGIIHDSNAHDLAPGLRVDHYLSARPRTPQGQYTSYYEKVTAYVNRLLAEAKAIDQGWRATTFAPVPADDAGSVFEYEDTASTRANIVVPTSRLRQQSVAIIGLGGTGAYLLDLLAKAPVREIHLWDGDVLQQHNAFRYPGAVPLGVLEEAPMKVTYLQRVYAAMRRHIVPHPEMIKPENARALRDFDYVFACVDNGEARRVILEALDGSSATLIDVGMGVRMNANQELLGQCRVTVVDVTRDPDAIATLPLAGEDEKDLYATNIQVADLNALNAFMAVQTWKKKSGYYASRPAGPLMVYSTSNSTMAVSEAVSCPA